MVTSLADRQSADTIDWLSAKDDDEWDEFVTRSPLGLVYHLSAWKRVIEDAFPHIRGRFLVLRNDVTGEIQAGLPVYTVKSWLLGNRVVSVPFASFCDPLVSTLEEFKLLLPRIRDMAKASGCRKIEIRSIKTAEEFSDVFSSAKAKFKHQYLPLDKSPEELFASFAKSSVCQKVNKARRAGIVVEEREDEEGLRICYSILVDTRRRHSLPPMPFQFFRAMKRWLGSRHMKVYLAIQKGEPVGCHLVLWSEDLWISEYSGSTETAIHGVNQVLYWDTIQCALASGAKRFSFGRTSVDNEKLLSYKRRWATVEEELVYLSCGLELDLPLERVAAIEPHDTSPAYRQLKLLIGKVPMPVYRWIGNYCYRHLG